MILPYSVYVLLSEKDYLLYIGFSHNPLKRLEAHNSGKNTSTRNRVPLKMIYCENYLFKSDALKREKYFKTSMGKKAIRLMLRNTLISLGYNASKMKLEFDLSETVNE